MPQATCPTLINYDAGEECMENLSGLGEVAYIGRKSDLAEPMVATENVYSMPKFKEGKGLKKLDLRQESQKIEGSNNATGKGYNLTCTLVFDAVNRRTSKLSRPLNNLRDLFIIIPDGDDNQIMYDQNKKLHADSGGITSTTGDTPDSDRITTANLILGPVYYSNLYVDFKADTEKNINSWDDLVVADE